MAQTDIKAPVSIINYQTADLTIQCAQSVLDDVGDLNVLIAIVDNASGDGSVDKLAQWIAALPEPQNVVLIQSKENTGFSGGHNQSMQVAEASYYLLLNSDAVLRPGFLRTILSTAEGQKGSGLWAPRIEYDSGEQQISCFRFHSPASELIRGAASGPIARALSRFKVPLDMSTAQNKTEWASFACILLRGNMIKQVGPMDPGYFLYFEDVEYCWRARKAGWGISYVPEAIAVHFRGGSGPVMSLAQAKKRLPEYYYASRTRMFYQFYGQTGLMLANLLWCLGRGVAHIRLLFGKSVPKTAAKEAADIWTNIFTPLGDSRTPKD